MLERRAQVPARLNVCGHVVVPKMMASSAPEFRPENDTDEQNKNDNDSGSDDALLIHSNVGQMKGHRNLSDLKCTYRNKQTISLPSNHLLQGARRTVYGGIGALELYTHLRQAS